MNQHYRQDYLSSAHWLDFRNRVLSVRNCCERCGLPNLSCRFFYGNGLDLHHLTYERIGHELDSDVVVLCRACHELTEEGHRQFNGYPEITLKCPECTQDLTLGIPEPSAPLLNLSTKQFIKQVSRPAVIARCECEIDDVNSFIAANANELLAISRNG